MMIRPFLNDRPDCGRGVCRTLTPWPGTPSIWQKKYSTITRGDVISYCPSDVDDTNTQHMIRYKHAGIQRSNRATLTGVGLSQRVVRLVDEEPTFFVSLRGHFLLPVLMLPFSPPTVCTAPLKAGFVQFCFVNTLATLVIRVSPFIKKKKKSIYNRYI